MEHITFENIAPQRSRHARHGAYQPDKMLTQPVREFQGNITGSLKNTLARVHSLPLKPVQKSGQGSRA